MEELKYHRILLKLSGEALWAAKAAWDRPAPG